MTREYYFLLKPEEREQLYLALKRNGIATQSELAKRMSWDQGNTSKKLNGKLGMAIEQLKRIYELAGSPPELLPIIERYRSPEIRIGTPIEEGWKRLIEGYLSTIKAESLKLPTEERMRVISDLEKFVKNMGEGR